jgi:uncharacterized protein
MKSLNPTSRLGLTRCALAALLFAAPLVPVAFHAPLPAVAQQLSLDQARMDGLVGERPDGLLGAVIQRPDIVQFVQGINAERMKSYQEISSAERIPLQQVQAIAGQKIIERLPKGSTVMTSDGKWVRK